VAAAALAAAALPSLLAYNPAPSPTFLNQALAVAGWGLFVAAGGWCWAAARGAPAALLAALAGVAGAALWSWGPGMLPGSLALSALGLLAAAAVLVVGGASARAFADRDDLFAAFCWGWLVAGLLNCGIGAVQVFVPAWADGEWIARSGFPGRAVGNLRQPNHLSSLLVWSAIAAVALLQIGRLRPALARAAFVLLIGCVVLTASRTGLVSVLLLAAWGALDRRLAPGTRALLLAAPLVYGLAFGGMWLWAQAGEHTFGGQARLQETDLSASRFGIWANTLALVAQQPFSGVGFGQFNLAWSMTAFPGRPTAFFDHAHNLPLHLAAELGLPLAGAVTALLLWALWRAWRSEGAPARCAWMFVLMIGLHSLLEYPLWYAYFLLPAAWAWGFALGAPQPSARPAAWPWPALLLVVGSALAVVDYGRVTRIFAAADAGPRATPLAQRIAEGRRSWLFSHHADYAAATTGLPQPDGLGAFDGAKHYLLDTRLMIAWADALAAAGRLDEARWVAARLREFGSARAADYFDACPKPPAPGSPAPAVTYQCQSPAAPVPWRDLARDQARPRAQNRSRGGRMRPSAAGCGIAATE
jgi:O-antigen ligase